MLNSLLLAIRFLILVLSDHKQVALENIALRHQLAVFTREKKPPRVCDRDRLFWIALKKDAPDDWVSFNNYGLFLLEHNRATEAREKFQRAINLNPDNVQGFVGIGEAFRQAGDMRSAQAWYGKALRMDPNQPVARQCVR